VCSVYLSEKFSLSFSVDDFKKKGKVADAF